MKSLLIATKVIKMKYDHLSGYKIFEHSNMVIKIYYSYFESAHLKNEDLMISTSRTFLELKSMLIYSRCKYLRVAEPAQDEITSAIHSVSNIISLCPLHNNN